MKRLMLDHFRRWWWVLSLGVAFAFLQGWCIAKRPETAFEFWIFLWACWLGGMLLNIDIKRGLVRSLAVVPLTGSQIGRSWWLATVPIPAMLLTAALFMGGGTYYASHLYKVFPAARLAVASLFALLWLGVGFTANFSNIYGPMALITRKRWNVMNMTVVSLLSTAMLFGGLTYFQDASKKPVKFAILLAAGTLLTVVGWRRAARFNLDWASYRLADLQPDSPRGQHHVSKGLGGIRFLIKLTFVGPFLTGLAMVALMALMLKFLGKLTSESIEVQRLVLPLMLWAGIFIQLIPIFQQMRYLRTMPLSASRMAVVLIAILILPLIALGAVVTGLTWAVWGTSLALMVLNTSIFILAPAALSGSVVVWRGGGILAYCFMGVAMLFGQAPWFMRVSGHPELSIRLTVTITVVCIALAILLTRQTLFRSSRPYRVQPAPLPGSV